ncbi:hypothetical protein [Hydrogenophaga sp. PBL-H3]|uniref:hypothetical protein n=1 Tax=Hydrogenophaga sp. PBL-H3 TaxID=434010 RepID=UPI00131F51C1|nr:hypothetical protein [Hydrogenophaga sp. PBL-H3]QHE76130.1 hypothetical protein F9Z45_08670 [Hydrogenophaga sp. PBL-H3]QHE80554.1 hypothetical protein F9Z44_08670 [Hydrogenophaga sp. PBL-H3]
MADWESHKRELASAQENYRKVIVISDQHHERYEAEHGLVYVPNEFWAGVERATCLPSKRGSRSLMADIIESLNGNVVGISPNREDVSDALS